MLFVTPAYATCPVCLVAVGGGLWLAEALGIDDLLAAIWIGAFVTALAVWWGRKFRLIKLPYPGLTWSVIFYLLTIATLYMQGKINQPGCQIWGICKIWLGTTLGTVVFLLGVVMDNWLRTKNDGKVFFPFQKVLVPLAGILMVTLVGYILVC